ncbi:MAG: FtsX-like permease family protein [Promethearchaeota archaeon]
MVFGRMAIRFLNKRRLRTFLTIIAIMLGVGILTGVNVTADSINEAVNAQIYEQLGNNDLIIKANKSIDGGWFKYNDAKNYLKNIDSIKTIVPRIIKNQLSYPISNHSGGWNILTIALDTSDPNEKFFGKCNITDALNPTYINTSKIEDLLQDYNHLFLPVVLSESYANDFGLKAGDPIYIYAEDPSAFSPMIKNNTSTWHNATIVGIIKDISEAVQDFTPPARIWELYPPSKAIYLDIQKSWNLVFNAHPNMVNMLFVQVQNPALIDSLEKQLENLNTEEVYDIFPGGIFAENVKSLFTSGILQINSMMRGIFSIFSGISLLVCAIIIKNLLEMAKEEQTHEIGIMRAVGVSKSKILYMYIVQILFISIIGSILGIIFGYFLSSFFTTSYTNTASAVGADFSSYDIRPTISAFTIFVGISAGVLVSLLFGFFPARAAANVDPLEALRSYGDKPRDSLFMKTIKSTGNLSLAAGFTAGGIFAIISAFGGLFILDIINPEVILLLFLGVIALVIGIVLFGAFFFPILVSIIGILFIPLLGKIRTVTIRNLKRYSRQTKNTFAMLAIGLCMMITVGTIMNSAYEGAYPGGKTITGGDLQVGDLYRGHVPKDPHSLGLKNLNYVENVVPIRFSIGFEGLTRVESLENNKTFGGIADSLFGPVKESFHLGIVDPIEYFSLHSKDSIVKFSKKDSFYNAMNTLNTPYTVILQDRLAKRLGDLQTGEYVKLRFEGFEAVFLVVGIFEILPGFYWTYYTSDSAFDKQFAGAISWATYNKLIEDNIGKIDVIARNKVIPNEFQKDLLPDESLWGYTSIPLDYKSLESLAYQTGLVVNSSRRVVSPFWGIPSFQWKTNVTLYDPNINLSEYDASPADPEMQEELGLILNKTWALQNVLWHEEGAITRDWNAMLSRSYVLDPEYDFQFGNTTIKSTLPQIPIEYRDSIENIFKWAKKMMPNANVCIVNELYVNYNISSGKFNYIKKFVPGENIRLYFNESIYTDFLVIATTNSHYPYEYIDEKGYHHGDTAVFNYEALSYNTYKYNGTDWNYFFEVLDAEANSIFFPNRNYSLPKEFTQQMLPDLIDLYLYNISNNNSTNGDNQSNFPNWVTNNSINTMFWINISEYFGDLNTTDWNATYSYNNTVFTLNGTIFTVQGQDQEVNFTLIPENGTEIIEKILNGTSEISFDNFTTQIYFDLNDSMTANDIKTWIKNMEYICKTIPTLENITFFAPKLFLLEDSGLFDVYFLIGVESKDRINEALYEIENYYTLNNLGWSNSWIKRSIEIEEQVGGILRLIINMFMGVLSFALIASLLGLAISTIISIRKRYAEIGVLRTLGFSNAQILRMIIGEGVITSIIGILVGLTAGLLIAYLIISNLPFMIFLPMVFAPPIELILGGLGILILASIIVSFLPAISATRIDIANAIRMKGE